MYLLARHITAELRSEVPQLGFREYIFWCFVQCVRLGKIRESDLAVISRLYWYVAASIGTDYGGVTVLLPGWVIWEYWNCPSKFVSLGSWLVSALLTPNGEEGYNSSTDLNPNTIT